MFASPPFTFYIQIKGTRGQVCSKFFIDTCFSMNSKQKTAKQGSVAVENSEEVTSF
jgi:hypothetical protein